MLLEEFTVSYVSEPYIYPDLSQIDEYRKSRTIKDPKDGRVLDSNPTPHRVQAGQVSAKLFNARSLFTTFSSAGAGELKGANPPLVLVLGLDADRYSKDYLANVLADRLAYAKSNLRSRTHATLPILPPTRKTTLRLKSSLIHSSGPRSASCVRPWLPLTRPRGCGGWNRTPLLWTQSLISAPILSSTRPKSQSKSSATRPIIPPESIRSTLTSTSPRSRSSSLHRRTVRAFQWWSYLVRNDAIYGRMLLDYLRDPLHRQIPWVPLCRLGPGH